MQLSREVDKKRWHFLLLLDNECDQLGGLAMAPNVTKAAYFYVEYDKADLRQLLSCTIKAGS